jgi:hypothetical protein
MEALVPTRRAQNRTSPATPEAHASTTTAPTETTSAAAAQVTCHRDM